MACTAKLMDLPPDVVARTDTQLASSLTPDAKGRTLPQGTIEWPALKQMLDRGDPSYRT
jgi:hypothetical protein